MQCHQFAPLSSSITSEMTLSQCQADFAWLARLENRRVGGGGGGGSRASNEPPLEVNNGGLKTQTVDFQLLANSGGMENKL